MRLGIDTGGTFSDFVLIDEASGAIEVAKVSSTPADPPAAIRAGLAKLFANRSEPVQVDQVIVGTTVATNAVIQRRGPRVIFVTNEGFTDVPFIARIDKERPYDVNWQKPKPLVRRRDCYGVRGRIGHHGEELVPLDLEDLQGLRDLLTVDEPVVVAVCGCRAPLPWHEP